MRVQEAFGTHRRLGLTDLLRIILPLALVCKRGSSPRLAVCLLQADAEFPCGVNMIARSCPPGKAGCVLVDQIEPTTSRSPAQQQTPGG